MFCVGETYFIFVEVNAVDPMFTTPFPIVTLMREEQPVNASFPMLVTPFPITTLEREEQW